MLTANQIWESIVSLSNSQGYYTRLRKALEICPQKEEILESWSKNCFDDIVDFIMWLEESGAYGQLNNSLPEIAFIECDNGNIGNGFIYDKYLFTAGHVVNGSENIRVVTPTKNVDISTSSALIICYDTPRLDDMNWNDFAIFKAKIPLSSFGLYTRQPNIEDVLECKILKMTYRGIEKLEVGCKVAEIDGNFIGCYVDTPLSEGLSGAPLVHNGTVYGMLIGGDNGNPCLFQSIESILRKMKEDGVPNDIGWYY